MIQNYHTFKITSFLSPSALPQKCFSQIILEFCGKLFGRKTRLFRKIYKNFFSLPFAPSPSLLPAFSFLPLLDLLCPRFSLHYSLRFFHFHSSISFSFPPCFFSELTKTQGIAQWIGALRKHTNTTSRSPVCIARCSSLSSCMKPTVWFNHPSLM